MTDITELMSAAVDAGEKITGIEQMPLGPPVLEQFCCPTCGTPANCHPDRVRGEDALPVPEETLQAGENILSGMMQPAYDDAGIRRQTAESVFRAMLEASASAGRKARHEG